MSQTTAHLSELTLEQLAEGTLASAEAERANRHLGACGRCAAELEGHRVLLAMLSELPRFAPSANFGDAVMARVQIAPKTSPVVAWVQQWLPTTQRGWTMLGVAVTAPAIPLLALVAWLITHPLISPAGLWQWGSTQAQASAQTVVAAALESNVSDGLVGWGQVLWSMISSVPVGTLAGVLAFLAVAIPLSAWSLVRLVRTPMGTVTYAN